MSLECAMDELAERLGLDPVELRNRNEPPLGRLGLAGANYTPWQPGDYMGTLYITEHL